MNRKAYNILMVLMVSVCTVVIVGCAAIDLVATPTQSEEVIEAEFNLPETEGLVLVFVRQPGWIRTPVDLRRDITDSMILMLENKAEIPSERLIDYDRVANVRRDLEQVSRDDAFAYAQELDAEYVVIIEVDSFDLSTFAERNFFNGSMKTSSCLYDKAGKKLWPQDNGCRSITVGVEAQKGNVESVVKIFSMATAHCVSRYYYNCMRPRFKIAEEIKYEDYSW